MVLLLSFMFIMLLLVFFLGMTFGMKMMQAENKQNCTAPTEIQKVQVETKANEVSSGKVESAEFEPKQSDPNTTLLSIDESDISEPKTEMEQ